MSSTPFAIAPSPGVAALDELHRLCRDAIEELANVHPARLASSFGKLLDRLEYAFRQEEQWMDEIEYPALNSHREQHARVLGALHHVHVTVMGGDIALGRHVVDDLLPQWLSLHIETMDDVLAIALCENASDALSPGLKNFDALVW